MTDPRSKLLPSVGTTAIVSNEKEVREEEMKTSSFNMFQAAVYTSKFARVYTGIETT